MKYLAAILAIVFVAGMTHGQYLNQANPTPAFHPAKVGNILYQEPCYCYCDRAHGHTSLRSCFESGHGANCSTCMGEALYSYQMTKKGWSPQQIRDGIIRGDFKTMDLQHPAPVD